jgi:MoaA/NifB/PqqE/SkfB family radical SAM enzyme
MHVQRVVTNETCNQNCWFCNGRRPVEDPRLVSRAAVRRRIAEAQGAETREIVLTGGEPTLRSDLPDLVRRAAEGAARVVLETNASRLDETRARDLAAAGLAVARIQLLAWGTDAADAISREPGAFEAALRGLRALAGAGVTVEVTTPVVRRNLHLVAAMPAEIVANELPVAALLLVVPATAADPTECASLGEVAVAISAVADEARRVGLPLRLDPTTYVPPCAFERPERVAHLFALNRGNAARPSYERVAACSGCLVEDRCPGVPSGFLEQRDLPRLRPVAEQRLRRRLTVMSTVEEQVARELVSRDDARGGDARAVEVTVRVNFRCNQACEFCFVSTHLPSAPEAEVRAAIEAAAREHAVVVLSGGEPTLNPRLVDYVRLARELGAASVELQTNATRLAHAGLAAALAEAGLAGTMVSLHGSTAAISDAVTGAPGTFAATLRGIDALVQTSVRVRLNFVFCQENRDDFPHVVDLVAERWPTVGIVFSFVGSHTDVVPRSTALIPRFRDVMPSLLTGLARARAAGLDVTGFDSMCGLPLCLVPEAERAAFSAVALPPEAGAGEFVKAEACTRCAETHRCFGVRRGYAELHGTDELEPVAANGQSSRSLTSA